MSIINDQNILGDSTLALAARVGRGLGSAADYSFANQANMWEKNLYEAIGEARGGTWMQPISYAGEVAQAEVEKEPANPDVGVSGFPTQDAANPTRYGPEWKGDMAESDARTATTKLTQVAAVIAEEVDPIAPIVDPGGHAVKSATIVEEGVQGPVASGGEFFGYSANNEYHVNSQLNNGAGATTEPEVIETTGVEPYVQITPFPAATSTSDDAPPPVGSYAEAAALQNSGSKKKSKTKGVSTATMSPSQAMEQMAAQIAAKPKKKVHKSKAVGSYADAAALQNLGGDGPQPYSNGYAAAAAAQNRGKNGNPGGWGGH